jgi:hypothetical protein
LICEERKLKSKTALIIGILLLSGISSGALADYENTKQSAAETQEKIGLEAAKEHLLAAEELEESAAHHRKVAQFYKAGKFEDAGWNAYMAYAHSLRAQEHINAAAMLHLSEKRNVNDKITPTEPK